MKKTLYILTTILFSSLFYDQLMGLNALLFSILIIGVSYFAYKDELDLKTFSISSSLFLISGFSVFLYGNALAVIAYFMSFSVHVFWNQQKSLSLLTGICSLFANNLLALYRKFSKTYTEKKEKSKRKLNLVIFLLPIILLIVFIGLYRGVNDEFKILTDKINLDFISIGWLFFTAFGLIFLFPVFYLAKQKQFAAFEKNSLIPLKRPLVGGFLNPLLNLKTEYLSALISFVILNTLLFIVNILDVLYLYIKVEGTKIMGASESVHYGVGNLIWTIIISIIVILMFYSSRLNFIKQNKTLKLLTIVWIIQNGLLVISTVYRNYLYVSDMGLTYKRIGVYFYLLLTMIGLLITLRKVIDKLKVWRMVREFTSISFVLLVISSLFNWNYLVVKSQFNLNKQIAKTIDCNFLYQHSPTSLLYANVNDCPNFDLRTDRYYFFINEYENHDWRSFIYRDYLLYNKMTGK